LAADLSAIARLAHLCDILAMALIAAVLLTASVGSSIDVYFRPPLADQRVKSVGGVSNPRRSEGALV